MRLIKLVLFALLVLSFSNYQGLANGPEYPTLNTSSYIQTRYTVDLSSTDQFTIPRLRSDIWGDVNENVGYFVEVDVVASPALIYGWIDLKPNEATKLRVGRFYYPFGLEYTTPASKFDTINPTYCLWNFFGYSRDSGVQLSQNFDNFKYAVAFMNGADNQLTDDNESKDVLGRVVLKKFMGVDIGASFHIGTATSTEITRKRVGLELAYNSDKFGLKSEFIYGSDGGVRKLGFYVQPSLWINQALQGLVRYEYWDPDTAGAGDLQTVVTLGVNAFFDDVVKLQINYEFKKEEVDTLNDALLAQLQVMF